jgi:hypothetical protein
MTIGICPINKVYDAGTFPLGQRFLAGQIPMVKGSEMDFTLNDHGEMSISTFRVSQLQDDIYTNICKIFNVEILVQKTPLKCT